MIISGIYKITNNINGKCYIGCSKDIKRRWREHIKVAATKSQIHLAIKKYGVDNFTFEVLLKCPNICFDCWEKYYVKMYDSVCPNGYNLTLGGLYNITMTEETKEKLSKCNVGKVLSEDHKQKISESNLGKKRSEETKEKLSLSHLGNLHTEETKQKMSNTRIGRKHSEDHKQKISLSVSGDKHPLFGKKLSEDHKQKLSKSISGKKRSEETKARMSLAQKNRYKKEGRNVNN